MCSYSYTYLCNGLASEKTYSGGVHTHAHIHMLTHAHINMLSSTHTDSQIHPSHMLSSPLGCLLSSVQRRCLLLPLNKVMPGTRSFPLPPQEILRAPLSLPPPRVHPRPTALLLGSRPAGCNSAVQPCGGSRGPAYDRWGRCTSSIEDWYSMYHRHIPTRE